MAISLRDLGCRVVFASILQGSLSTQLQQEGFPVNRLSNKKQSAAMARGPFLVAWLRIMFFQFSLRRAIINCANQTRCEWVHVRHNNTLPLAAIAVFGTRRRAYWHMPNTINNRLPVQLQALLLQLFCRLFGIQPLANSRYTAKSLGDTLVQPKILALGSSGEYFSQEAVFSRINKRQVCKGEDLPVFAIVARVVPEKAQDRVIEAVAVLRGRGIQVKLLIVGGPNDTDYYAKVVQMTQHYKLQNNVIFLPHQSDPRPWFDVTDIVINSRTNAEPFGLSIVEAMLMERPVLAYKEGGPSEIIIDGKTGWLLDGCTAHDYAAGIERALSCRSKWRAMGTCARRHALKYFTLDVVADRYLEIVGSEVPPQGWC